MTTAKHNGKSSLLIAMNYTPDSIDLVRSVANKLSDPQRTRVTLMHYLTPLYWEHGGDLTDKRELRENVQEEKRITRIENWEEDKTRQRFQEARVILQEAGVPAANIRAELADQAKDTAHAVWSEVQNGEYSAVVVGQHDQSTLDRLFGSSLVDFLRQRAHDTAVWVVPQT